MGITPPGGGKNPQNALNTRQAITCCVVLLYLMLILLKEGTEKVTSSPCPCLEVLWELFGAGKLSW